MEKILYQVKELVDYEDKVHNVTACLIYDNVDKCIYLGYSISHPDDIYDSEIGETIAYERASTTENNYVYALKMGFLINNLDNILDMYLNYLVNNPGIMIKGYNKRKAKHNNEIKYKELINNLNYAQIEVLKQISNISEEQLVLARKLAKYV